MVQSHSTTEIARRSDIGGSTTTAWFITTGFPRSGNTWTETMISELPGVGGFAPTPDRGLPVTFEFLRGSAGLASLMESRGVSWENVVCRLLDPTEPGRPPFDEQDREVLSRVLAAELLPPIRRVRNIFDSNSRADRPGVELDRLVEPLIRSSTAVTGSRGARAFGLPSKHIAPAELRDLLPGFRIVVIVRDPRDVLVSKFYHDLGKLRQPLIHQLAKRLDDGRWTTREDWRERYFGALVDSMVGFYDGHIGSGRHCFEIRYEALIDEAARELLRLARWLGLSPAPDRVRAVVDRYRFDRVTGGLEERRNSFIRKGRPGDWRNYFDRRLIDSLGRPFVDLVERLGYEHDDAWVDRIPVEAPRSFEFSRFRIRRSATSSFINLWYASEELQRRYPDPFDAQSDDSFYSWLRRCNDPAVNAWFDAADSLVAEWRVDVVEDQYH